MTRILSIIAFALSSLVAYELVTGRRFGDGIGGAVAGLVTVSLCALVSYEVSWFEFDPRAATVTYRRQWAWRRYEGTLLFADIESVVAESAIGDGPVAHRRLVLRLRNGTGVPLTAGYAADGGEAMAMAAAIRAALGSEPLPTAIDRARVMARAGRTMEAVRELRLGTELSLEEAMRLVKEL
ncbi:MAG: hypothetical protein V4550_03495 [Gemmatimonadota bacterium]